MVKKLVIAISLVFLATLSASADFVLPKIGGAQETHVTAPMKHVDIMFDGTDVTLHLDDIVPTPHLRPLVPPNEFDPEEPWCVLCDKAYNFQYAFNPGGLITLPSGGGIWVERLFQDQALEVYLRPPMFTSGDTWPRLFAQDGDRWQWTSGKMQHNAYAVLNPLESVYTASYRVYIGDCATGEPLAGYGSEDVTLVWTATPAPEPSSVALVVMGLASLAACVGARRPPVLV
jgi:hypothetical protein